MAPGLRERKKRQTREAIVREGMRLFLERGFDETTVADIAEAADIAPRTFFAYFPSKEAVVFHEFDDVREAFAERLRDRRSDESAFDALRAWVTEQLERREAFAEDQIARRDLVRRTPTLEARNQANLASFGELIAEGVADDLGVPPDSLRPRLVSAAAVAAIEALRDFHHDGVPGDPAAVLDEALTFLQGGLEALRRRSPV